MQDIKGVPARSVSWIKGANVGAFSTSFGAALAEGKLPIGDPWEEVDGEVCCAMVEPSGKWRGKPYVGGACIEGSAANLTTNVRSAVGNKEFEALASGVLASGNAIILVGYRTL